MSYFAIMANSFNWRKYWFLTNDSTYRKRKHFAMRDLLLFNNNSIAHDKFILIFLKEHSKATTYIN